MKKSFQLFINGEFCSSQEEKSFESINPSNEEPIAEIALAHVEDVDRAVAAARNAFETTWRFISPKQRSRMLFQLAHTLEERVEDFAFLETLDTGKPLPLSRKEILSAARYFEYYAGAADKLHGKQIPLSSDYVDFTILEPKGVSAQIVPWNMPLALLARGVAPALAAGNTVVVKPATLTSMTALKFAELFVELSFPPGVYNVLPGRGSEVGAALASHRDVNCITFTGSLETGREVMKLASANITPVLLELGGKSPFVIFAEADLDLAVAEAVKGGYTNCGQICSAGSRILIEEKIKDAFVAKLVEKSQQMKIGPGPDSPDIGPLISADQRQTVLDYIEIGRKEAQIVTGGKQPAHLKYGFYVEPTVLTEVDPNARVAQEEIFGPVISVLSFSDEGEAVEIANNSEYGLVSGVFSNDINQALRVAKELRTGQVFVNEYFAGGEETPFGGYKKSGFGREKGLEGLKHYIQTKNIALRLR